MASTCVTSPSHSNQEATEATEQRKVFKVGLSQKASHSESFGAPWEWDTRLPVRVDERTASNSRVIPCLHHGGGAKAVTGMKRMNSIKAARQRCVATAYCLPKLQEKRLKAFCQEDGRVHRGRLISIQNMDYGRGEWAAREAHLPEPPLPASAAPSHSCASQGTGDR